MQVKYTGQEDVNGTDYARYSVIDGPADNSYQLFDVLVNLDDLVINVRGLASLEGGVHEMFPTTGVATVVSDWTGAEDGKPVYTKRVSGYSVMRYVASRAGRLTAQAYGVAYRIPTADAQTA